MDEGIRVEVRYLDYQVPGKRILHKVRSARRAIVLTRVRLIGFARAKRILNVRLDDPRLATLASGSKALRS